jgi:hypothetical protein
MFSTVWKSHTLFNTLPSVDKHSFPGEKENLLWDQPRLNQRWSCNWGMRVCYHAAWSYPPHTWRMLTTEYGPSKDGNWQVKTEPLWEGNLPSVILSTTNCILHKWTRVSMIGNCHQTARTIAWYQFFRNIHCFGWNILCYSICLPQGPYFYGAFLFPPNQLILYLTKTILWRWEDNIKMELKKTVWEDVNLAGQEVMPGSCDHKNQAS